MPARRAVAWLLLVAAAAGCDAKARGFFAPPLETSGGVRSGVIGTVLLDGEGLPGVTVVLTPTGRSAVTDVDGDYVLAPLPPGTYEVRVTDLPPGAVCQDDRQETAVGAEGLVRADFECFVAASIVGAATLDGDPFDGLAVTLSGEEDGAAESDAAGEFAFGGLPPGSYVVTPQPPAGIVCTPASGTLEVGEGETRSIGFECTALGTVEGTVTLDGAPFPDVSIAIAGAATASTVTDLQGSFAFTALPAGQVSVAIGSVPAGVACTPASHSLTVVPATVLRADFACRETEPDPVGTFDIVYTPVSNSCGIADPGPETGSFAPVGSDLALSVPHTPSPIVGPYDGPTHAFGGTTGWQDATGELAFGGSLEKRESWEVVFEIESDGTTGFEGSVAIEFREEGSGSPLCRIDLLVQGTGGT